MAKNYSKQKLESAYDYCQQMAKSHYENFPVASSYLPRHIRRAITVIYAFARTADDFADEGDLPLIQRQEDLAQYHQQLSILNSLISQGKSCAKYYENMFTLKKTTWINEDIFIALDDVIRQFKLPLEPLHRLLIAFEQDITKNYYLNKEEVFTYCNNSANPVGQLLLHLNTKASKQNYLYSNLICTALQLINFIQDYQQDALEMNRLYIPLEDLAHMDIKPSSLLNDMKNGAVMTDIQLKLYQQQIHRAETVLQAGKPLMDNLSGRFKVEIKLIYQAGKLTLDKLKEAKSFADRPRLNKWHRAQVLLGAFSN